MNQILNLVYDTAVKENWNLYDMAVLSQDGEEHIEILKANPCNDSYSVAKLFTLTALGMLWDEKKLSLDEKIRDIFSDEFPQTYDPRWDKVTVEQVIKHRFGTGEGYLDIDVEDIQSYGTEDFLQVVFAHPLAYEPGTHDQYSDAAYYLLSRVVTKKTGEKLDDFLLPRLFNPLHFQEMAWSKCPKGYPMGATGLYIRTQDMVKLGWVYLNEGNYQGHQIVSKEFAKLAVEKGYELGRIEKDGLYGKGGMRGQMVMFSVKDHLALAWHACQEEETALKVRSLILDQLNKA